MKTIQEKGFGTIDEVVTVDSGATVMELPKPIASWVLNKGLQDVIFNIGHILLYCAVIHPFYNWNVYPGTLFLGIVFFFFFYRTSQWGVALSLRKDSMLRHFRNAVIVRTTRAH